MAVKKKKPAKKPVVKSKPAAAKGKAASPKKVVAKPAKSAKPVKKVAVKKALAPSKVAKKGPEKKLEPKKVAAGKAVAAPKKVGVAKPEPAELKGKKPTKGKAEPTVEVEVAAPAPESEEVVLTDAEGRRYCRVKDCDQLSVVDGYCRYHYLLFWKKIQVRKKILSEGKLERYIEDLTARYPDKFLDMLRKDLRSEKEFLAAIAELEIDESAVDNEFEDETQNYLDEVRGMGAESTSTREDEDF